MSRVVAELREISGEIVDLRNLTKFADLLLAIDEVADNYLAIKDILRVIVVDGLLELLDDYNQP